MTLYHQQSSCCGVALARSSAGTGLFHRCVSQRQTQTAQPHLDVELCVRTYSKGSAPSVSLPFFLPPSLSPSLPPSLPFSRPPLPPRPFSSLPPSLPPYVIQAFSTLSGLRDRQEGGMTTKRPLRL